jgi:hypothetical protein
VSVSNLITEIAGIQNRADLLDREIVRVHALTEDLGRELANLGHKQRSLRSAILTFIDALERYDQQLAIERRQP